MVKCEKKKPLLLSILLIISLPAYFTFSQVTASPAIGCATTGLYPVADAYVNSSSPDANYGTVDHMYVANNSEQDFVYVMFDLSSIPSEAYVISAKLKLYLSSTHGVEYMYPKHDKIGAYYCSENSWTELGITWNNKPSFNPEPTAVYSFLLDIGVFTEGYKSWDVTEDVRTTLPSGTLTEVLKFKSKTGDGYVIYHSKEGDNEPVLEVNHTTEPAIYGETKIDSVADAYVNSSSPDANYGTVDHMYVANNSEQDFVYVMFDLSSIPSEAYVISAKLKLYLSSTHGDIYWYPSDKIGAYYCSENSWTELGITWNNKPSFNPEPTKTWSFPTFYYVKEYKSWDVTEDVRTTLPSGTLTEVLKFKSKTGDGYAVYHSKEGTNKPRLEIEYAAPFTRLQIETTNGGTTGPIPGTYKYVNSTLVDVAAIPNLGYSFDYWLLDEEERTENPIAVFMDANHTLEAFFVDDILPEIGVPMQEPSENVSPYQNVTVAVNATDFGMGLHNVTLWYSINNGTTWVPLNMTEISANTCQATIPGFENGTWITYKITADDNNGNQAINDNQGHYYIYHVIPEFPSFLILPLFITATLLAVMACRRKNGRHG